MSTLNLASLILTFLGTVLLSIGLLRSRQQIEDESSTYYGFNPFVKANMSDEQRVILPGFLLLITGFAFQIAIQIPGLPTHSDWSEALMIGSAITLAGIVVFLVFIRSLEEKRKRQHQVKYVKSLLRDLEGYKNDFTIEQAPLTLQTWIALRARNLRNFKGDIPNDTWKSLSDLISRIEGNSSITVQEVKLHITAWLNGNATLKYE